ncbi:hypothetical protein M408DRAFT_135681 [Serendipita vermifera MAFF 305830]|uniref:Uncharacterized protein n=1 Tax=Serendipita vermifera MAFF 305830 TaxID=933852 RepID=A0A0C3AK84_SERVB|nr:hypothetical protein M408DRAFT_135681 [Serendipita vermifera MAFF 305830]
MGIQQMVKSLIRDITEKNSTNVQAGNLWADRMTDIAHDLEQTPDPTKVKEMVDIASKVAVEFSNDDIRSQTGAITFLKRQQSIMQAEARLDQLKVPSADRDRIMQVAMQRDLKRLGKNLRDICEISLPLIREICDILPNKKSLRTDGVSEEILGGSAILPELQRLTATFNQKLLDLQELGYIDPSIMIAIIQLEDPDAEPLHWRKHLREEGDSEAANDSCRVWGRRHIWRAPPKGAPS